MITVACEEGDDDFYIARQDSVNFMETLLLDESGREFAFEAVRFGDLMRYSVRNNDNSILSKRVGTKLENSGKTAGKDLMNRENWYIKGNHGK